MEFAPTGTARIRLPFACTSPRSFVLDEDLTPVRRALRYLLAIPPNTYLRRIVLRASPVMGHASETPPRAQDATVGGGAHISHLRDEDGRHAECQQFDHEQHRRARVQLACGHASSTSGELGYMVPA